MSIAVPHITHFLPPLFSDIFPAIVEAHAEVGSVAKTNPADLQYSVTVSVIVPASHSTIENSKFSSVTVSMPLILRNFSVFITMVFL